MFLADLFGVILNFLYNFFGNYGIAIIIFSIFLRLILVPLTFSQQKSMKKTGEIQGQLKAIQDKYKNNPEKLNQETMELYKREKINPFSGCLSAILQIFIILSVFWLVSSPLTHMKNLQNTDIYKQYSEKVSENKNQRASYKEIAMINLIESDYKEIENRLNQENIENKDELLNQKQELEKLRINMNFLGLDLSKVPTQSLNDFKVYIIPVLYVISSFVSIKITSNSQNKKLNNQISETDPMQNMGKGMNYLMPIMSVSIAIVAPLGLALYWFISNTLMILERIIINKITDLQDSKKA